MSYKKKYVVISGYVKSINDGQIHKITCIELVRLYNVDPKECIFFTIESYSLLSSREVHNLNRYIHLRPRQDGKYEIPK